MRRAWIAGALCLVVVSVGYAFAAKGAEHVLSPEELGQALVRQQEGVDKADSFLLEWEVSPADAPDQPRNRHVVAWRNGDSYYRHERLADGHTNTAAIRNGVTTTLATSTKREPEAHIWPFPYGDVHPLRMAWVFFPVLHHFWNDDMAGAALRQASASRRELLRRVAEAEEGRKLASDQELLAALLRQYGSGSEMYRPQSVTLPEDTHRPAEGNLAFACRLGRRGWFSIVELDARSLWLKRLVTFVNRRDMPDEVAQRFHTEDPIEVAETWELQATYALGWRRIEFSEHRELPLGIVMPTRVDFHSCRPDGEEWTHNVYRVTRVEVNSNLSDEQFEIDFPEGTDVYDGSYDPQGFIAVRYTQDSARTGEEWQKVLAEGMVEVNAELEQRREIDAMLGRPAPELSARAWVKDPAVGLADLKGRYVVLLFSSLGCGPCVREAPGLPRMAERLAQAGGSLVNVFAANDSEDKVRELAEANGLEFPICISTGDGWGDVFAAYHVEYIPKACLIDPEGNFLAQGGSWELCNFVEQIHKLAGEE